MLAIYEVADLLLMVAAFGLTVWVVAFNANGASLVRILSVRLKIINFVLFLGFLILWHLFFQWLGLYRSQRLRSLSTELIDVAKATSLGSVAIFNAGLLFDIQLITVRFAVIFWLISTVLAIGVRLGLRLVLRWARSQGRNLSRILIVGTNARALKFAEEIRSRSETGFVVVGFCDKQWHGLLEFEKKGEDLVVDLDNLQAYLRRNVIDEVILALPASCYADAAEVVSICEVQGITVRLLASFFNLRLASTKVDSIEDMHPVLTVSGGSMEGGELALKRAFDFTLASFLLIIQAPLFLLAALAVKGSSPGPVFFVQERIGLNKRRFQLFKFRTMAADADLQQGDLEHLNEISGPVFKMKSDPRVTAVGRFLRRVSLDEMPQLINVLVGDMSLVGPRPLPVRDYEGFSEDWHRRRFSVRPGMTCLWQVHGRSSIPFERWMELDMQYIDQWSFWLDFVILAKTVPAVIRGTGAT